MCYLIRSHQGKNKEDSKMAGILENALLLGLGTLSIARKESEALLRDVLKRHNIPEGECKSILKAVAEEGAKSKEAIENEIERVVESRGSVLVPGNERIEALEARVAELEKKLDEAKTAKKEK